jgi:hypothetical protein
LNEQAADELFHKLSLHTSSESQSITSDDDDDDESDDDDEDESEEDEEELSPSQPGKCVTLYEEHEPEMQCAIVQGAGSTTKHCAPSVEGM